jgi:hypothetical protein
VYLGTSLGPVYIVYMFEWEHGVFFCLFLFFVVVVVVVVVSMLRIWSHGYNSASVISISLNIGYILIYELGHLPIMPRNTYDL